MPFEAHCIIELMGHSRIAGKVTEEEIAGTPFLRVDVPAIDGIEAHTKFFSASAVYGITPVDEAICQRAVEGFRERPIEVWRLASESPQLAEKVVVEEDSCGVDDDYEDDDDPLIDVF